MAERPVIRKEYYSIGEVCDIVGLKPHVLRYWETQFTGLNPSKNRSGNRAYQAKEIELILLVKDLLYTQKYTIEGAKQQLRALRKESGLEAGVEQALDRQTIAMLRRDLEDVLDLLAGEAAP